MFFFSKKIIYCCFSSFSSIDAFATSLIDVNIVSLDRVDDENVLYVFTLIKLFHIGTLCDGYEGYPVVSTQDKACSQLRTAKYVRHVCQMLESC